MHGVYLFGSEGSKYSVSLTIDRLPGCTTFVYTNGTFSSLQHKSKNFWGFDVLLEPPVSLIKGNRYQIEAHISGPKSFSGGHGKIHSESTGVTFNFEDRENFQGGTGAERGQLPEFIFSLQK